MFSLAVYAPGSPAFAQDKLPIPSAEAQRDALALIKEVYGQELKAAKTPEQKTALAQKLLDKSREATEDATRFALIRVSRDLAVQGGDVSVAFRAIEVTSYRFQIDTFAAKVRTLLETAKSASTPAHQKAVATEGRKLIEKAVEEDDFETVSRLYETAAATARSAHEWDLAREIVARNREIEEVAAAHAAIDDAVTLLKLDPVDPEANLAVGKYHCLIKGNWSRGLPMLALGNDEKLKELSVKELREVSDTDGQVALGDGWWDVAATSEGVAQKQLQERAALWYRKALPGLSGLVRDRVAGRLKDLADNGSASKTPTSERQDPSLAHRRQQPVQRIEYYVWEWLPSGGNPFKLKFYGNGTVSYFSENSGNPKFTWSLNKNILVLTWYKNGWIDTLTVSPDGRTARGRNQYGRSITARLLGTNLE
jgi:hypothetical protein